MQLYEISQASEQERKGCKDRLIIAFKRFVGFTPSPKFNSLPALHVHVTDLKFSGKRTTGPVEKVFI